MDRKIKILIADDQQETCESIHQILILDDQFEVMGYAHDGKETIKKAQEYMPDVILMDINMPRLNGLEATEIISREYPEIIVIIMSVQNETEYLKKAMMNGAREYIIKPFDTEQIISTILTVVEKDSERITVKRKATAEVVSFFSAKGGVGKTVLASNYGVMTSKNEKTIILDLDLYFGDVSIIMNKKPIKNIYHVIQDEAYLSYDYLKDYIVTSSNGKVDLLLAPARPEKAEVIEPMHIQQIIEHLKKHYQKIIIDLGTNYSEMTLSALEQSDVIYLVMTPELTALKNTKLSLEIMESLEFSLDRVKVILNQENISNRISKNKIKEILKKPIEVSIPKDEKSIMKAVQSGTITISSFGLRTNKVVKKLEKIINIA